MYDGYDPKTNQQIGPHTGDPRSFNSIEEWITAYQKQWDYFNDATIRWSNMHKHISNEHYGTPFADMLHPDCIEKEERLHCGGCRYATGMGDARLRVFADVSDSLIAIKKYVYDEKKLTIDEILDACKENFESERGQRIRDMLLAAPKFGNDLDEPDEMYFRLNQYVAQSVRAKKNLFGVQMRASWGAASLHIPFGKVIGALPNGKTDRYPVADGSISPVAGADIKGPTASIRSAGKCVDWSITTDAVLNQKMPKKLLQTKEQYEKFWSLTENYFEDFDGYQIQWNIEDVETYKAAQKDPEHYKDLIVRVGGYSAYFIEIDPKLQDEIIKRTEQYI